MTFKTVRVTKPGNRLIYINGDYTEAAGNSSDGSFTVPTGGQVFETLTGDRKVDFCKRFRVRPTDAEVTVELDPVDPPRPVGA
jgi:hypothetical protein